MDFLQRLFRRDRSVPVDNVEGLLAFIRSWGTTESKAEAVAQALRSLGGFPSSKEALDCLLTWANTATVSKSPTDDAAIEGLGLLGSPPAIERLAKIAASTHPSSSWEKASEALRHPRNKAGIGLLLDLALTLEQRAAVSAALRALSYIGTAEANAALDAFRQRPSRRLYETYFETPEPRFSSDLGQKPGPDELLIALNKLGDDIRFGSPEQALEAVKRILEAPESWNLTKLENFLKRDNPAVPYPNISKLTAYPSELTKAGLKAIVGNAIAEAPARKRAIREVIISGDVTALCAFLSEGNRRVDYKTIWSIVNNDTP